MLKEEQEMGIKTHTCSKAEFLKELLEKGKTCSELETLPIVCELLPLSDTESESRKGH